MHRCYACEPGNAHRIFGADEDALSARVPARFVGPPGNANGGIATGMLACPALRAATRDGIEHAAVTRISARIRAGVPVEAALSTAMATANRYTAEGGCAAHDVTISDAERPLVTGTVELTQLDKEAEPGQELAGVPPELVAEALSLSRLEVPERPPFYVETGEHPIAGCFSCGPEHPDGLHIYPRVVEDGIVCAPWLPAPKFIDGDGMLSTLVLTSAIDCSSGICMPVAMQRELLELDQFFLLGSLDVRYLRMAPVDRGYRVAAKMLRRDGRKFFGLSALVDDGGAPYAIAESTWVIAGISRTLAFGERA